MVVAPATGAMSGDKRFRLFGPQKGRWVASWTTCPGECTEDGHLVSLPLPDKGYASNIWRLQGGWA